MSLYAVVWISGEEDGSFQDDPDWFDFLDEAKKYRDRMLAKHPDRFYVILHCDEVT